MSRKIASISVFLPAAILLLLTAGCGGAAAPIPSPTATPTLAATPTPIPTPTVEVVQVPTPTPAPGTEAQQAALDAALEPALRQLPAGIEQVIAAQFFDPENQRGYLFLSDGGTGQPLVMAVVHQEEQGWIADAPQLISPLPESLTRGDGQTVDLTGAEVFIDGKRIFALIPYSNGEDRAVRLTLDQNGNLLPQEVFGQTVAQFNFETGQWQAEWVNVAEIRLSIQVVDEEASFELVPGEGFDWQTAEAAYTEAFMRMAASKKGLSYEELMDHLARGEDTTLEITYPYFDAHQGVRWGRRATIDLLHLPQINVYEEDFSRMHCNYPGGPVGGDVTATIYKFNVDQQGRLVSVDAYITPGGRLRFTAWFHVMLEDLHAGRFVDSDEYDMLEPGDVGLGRLLYGTTIEEAINGAPIIVPLDVKYKE